MKTKQFGLLTLTLLLLLHSLKTAAQDPVIIQITKAHFDLSHEGTLADLLKLEKEYHQKVSMKNEFLLGTDMLLHEFTPDASEVLFIQVYKSFEDIDKAADEDVRLSKLAWPDSLERVKLGKERNGYYTTQHSDEIYTSFPYFKTLPNAGDSTFVILMKKNHRAFPENGSGKEFRNLYKEWFDHTIQKNKWMKGYYPMYHHTGSDGRDFVEFMAFESLDAMDKGLTALSQLGKEHWPDATKRKEFFTKFGRYFEDWHGDYVYTSVPELHK